MIKRDIRSQASEISDKVCETMYGVEDAIRLCLVALFTHGHVLLEGNPGMGKTALVKALGGALRLRWGRIQFTPDLMPADITGTEFPRDGKFEFQYGPIFRTLLLADEINRASPKTQSAMLEAMAERQVTVLGKTYPLSRFFTVFATQNPIDHEGVYPLPEAQADRFMFKICLYPQNLEKLSEIVNKDAGKEISRESILDVSETEDEGTQTELSEFYSQIRSSVEHPAVRLHVQNMYLASNLEAPSFRGKLEDRSLDLGGEQRKWIEKNAEIFQFGLGPRAATAITLAAKAWCLMFPAQPHDNATASDLAKVVLPVLRHRLKLVYDWEDLYEKDPEFQKIKNLDSQQKVDWLLTLFVRNTAPKQDGYTDILNQQLKLS